MINFSMLPSGSDYSPSLIEFGLMSVNGRLVQLYLTGPLIKRSGDYSSIDIEGVNTGKPVPFAVGIYGRESVGNEKNCEHTTLSGNFRLGSTIPNPLNLPYSLDKQYQKILDDFYYSRFIFNGNPLNYNSIVSARSTGHVWSSTPSNLSFIVDPPNGVKVKARKDYYSTLTYSVNKDTIVSTKLDEFTNGSSTRTTILYTRTGSFASTSNYVTVAFDYVMNVSHNTDPIVTTSGQTTLKYYFSSPGDTVLSYDLNNLKALRRSLINRLNNIIDKIRADVVTLSHYSCCRDAVESISPLDMNNLENVTDLVDPKGLLPPVRDLLNIKKNPAKGLASLHLWLTYALKTSTSDIASIITNYPRVLEELGRSQPSQYTKYGTEFINRTLLGETVQVRMNSKVCCYPNYRTDVEKLAHQADALGLMIGIAPSWDLIPFSFVVDWFFKVGDFFASIDYALFTLNRYNIKSVTNSTKLSIPLTATQLGIGNMVEGSATLTYYRRQADRTLPPNEFLFGSSNPTRHIFDGLALIIANW